MRNTRTFGVVLTTAVAVVLTASPALAYPTTTFDVTAPGGSPGYAGGYASGSFTWFNRSVGVQGSVLAGTECTTVEFGFYTGSTLYDVQSRYTCSNRSYNFTDDASTVIGGITKIRVWVCPDGYSCASADYTRP